MDLTEQQIATIRHERLVRNASCLGLTETVAGFQLSPITPRIYTALAVARSPYLPPFKTPEYGDTIQALWLLNPEFRPGRIPAWFYRECCSFVPKMPPHFWRTRRAMAKHQVHEFRCLEKHAIIVKSLRDFVTETLMDAPPQVHKPGIIQPEFYCDAVAICTQMAREFGGGLTSYLNLPLKFIFQAQKEISEHYALVNGKTPIMFNASDADDDARLEAMNRELHKTKKMHPAVTPFIRN